MIEAVRRGRREEFSEFGWGEEVPDPQDETTFTKSRLKHRLKDTDPHRVMLLFYRELIRFRRANHLGEDAEMEITESENPRMLTVIRKGADRSLLMIFNFDAGEAALPSVAREGNWIVELHSADSRWLGPNSHFSGPAGPATAITLAGYSFVVFSHEVGV